MRVLYCAAPGVGLMGPCGGVYKLMQLYGEALKDRGHVIEYLSLWQEPDWSRYDLCHLFMANGNSFSIGMIVKPQLPLVVSPIIDELHSNALLRLNVCLDRYVPVLYTHIGRCAALCRMADMICLMSTYERRCLALGLGIDTQCMIVHGDVSSKTVAQQAGRFEEYANKDYILFIGDAGNPRKNVVRLIKAVRKLDVELVIGGMISEGQTAKEVHKLVEKTANAYLIGFLEESEKVFLLRHARVFALPSLMEGIGLAAVEAGLRGTTVVVTKNGGAVDYFANQAYYVNPFSVNDIRDKIQQACVDPLDASEWIRQQFSLERTAKQLEACYEKCINSRLEGIRA